MANGIRCDVEIGSVRRVKVLAGFAFRYGGRSDGNRQYPAQYRTRCAYHAYANTRDPQQSSDCEAVYRRSRSMYEADS